MNDHPNPNVFCQKGSEFFLIGKEVATSPMECPADDLSVKSSSPRFNFVQNVYGCDHVIGVIYVPLTI